MRKICNGSPDYKPALIVWTDGSGVAACGCKDAHGPHVYVNPKA